MKRQIIRGGPRSITRLLRVSVQAALLSGASLVAGPGVASAQPHQSDWVLQAVAGHAWFSFDLEPATQWGMRTRFRVGDRTALYFEGAWSGTREHPPENCANPFCETRDPVSAWNWGIGLERSLYGGQGRDPVHLMLDMGLGMLRRTSARSGIIGGSFSRHTVGLQLGGATEVRISRALALRFEAMTQPMIEGCDFVELCLRWFHVARGGLVFDTSIP